MDISLNIDRHRVLNHSMFWFIWVSSFTVIQSFGYTIDYYVAWMDYYLLTLPLFVAHTYLIAYWLVPRFFFERRFLKFSIWVFVLLILASVGELVLSNELIWKLVKPEFVHQGNYLRFSNILINGVGNEYIILVFLSVKVIRLWYSKIGEKTELLNRKLSTEIALLQYQSYPRFVLNAMDRLELVAQAHSEKTSEMIIRFSDLMNHMTGLQKTNKIMLRKEVEMIKNYIDIQRASFPAGFDVDFQITGMQNYYKIPPFLFFGLVEEGFRVLGDFPKKSDFTIQIMSGATSLIFSMTLWNPASFSKSFDTTIVDDCRKYLAYFYPESNVMKTSLERNYVELRLEIHI